MPIFAFILFEVVSSLYVSFSLLSFRHQKKVTGNGGGHKHNVISIV